MKEFESEVRTTRLWIHDGTNLNIGKVLCLEKMFRKSCPVCDCA